jgi:hypothetical protein
VRIFDPPRFSGESIVICSLVFGAVLWGIVAVVEPIDRNVERPDLPS